MRLAKAAKRFIVFAVSQDDHVFGILNTLFQTGEDIDLLIVITIIICGIPHSRYLYLFNYRTHGELSYWWPSAIIYHEKWYYCNISTKNVITGDCIQSIIYIVIFIVNNANIHGYREKSLFGRVTPLGRPSSVYTSHFKWRFLECWVEMATWHWKWPHLQYQQR